MKQQLFGNEWAVVLSYFPKTDPANAIDKPDWLWAIQEARRFREFTIDRTTGEVTAMRDPRLVS